MSAGVFEAAVSAQRAGASVEEIARATGAPEPLVVVMLQEARLLAMTDGDRGLRSCATACCAQPSACAGCPLAR